MSNSSTPPAPPGGTGGRGFGGVIAKLRKDMEASFKEATERLDVLEDETDRLQNKQLSQHLEVKDLVSRLDKRFERMRDYVGRMRRFLARKFPDEAPNGPKPDDSM